MEKAILDFLIKQPLFSSLTSEEMTKLGDRLIIKKLQEGELIINEGKTNHAALFIYEGEVAIIKEVEGAGDIILTYLAEGTAFGELNIIDESPSSATLQAVRETIAIGFTKDDFDIIANDMPETSIKLLKNLSRILSLNMRKIHSRISDYMLPLG